MNSRREEERNEKIIRGLMKLPPNRRCINCNNLGPQYVCTNFWTFVCTTCSGIHREFTHRVKSVSMAKFTSQEVDALQRGGNQRAKELYLKAWDPQRNRIPNNSNVDKLRQFIKDVYLDKKYSREKSSDRPPRDPQSLRSSCEDETRRASSYHSYSQSPPYDFQYEERRYGKHAPGLNRRVGSDHGLYDGKLTGFLSPTHLSDDGFASEESSSRALDYSASGGGDALRSDFSSPSPNRDNGSPFSDTSRQMPSRVPRPPTGTHDSDAKVRDSEGRIFSQQRSASLGSFGSFDTSPSFKSVNSSGLPQVDSEPAALTEDSLHKSSSCPSLPPSSVPGNFSRLDLFSAPFTPQDVADTPPTRGSSQFLSVSSAESQPQPVDMFASVSDHKSKLPETSQVSQPPLVDLFDTLSQQQSNKPRSPVLDLFAAPLHQLEISQPPSGDLFVAPQKQSSTSQIPSLDLFATQQNVKIQQSLEPPQPPPLDLFSALPQQPVASGKASDVVMPGNGGWATFDTLQNMGSKNSVPATVPSFDENASRNFNPFSDYQSSHQDSAGRENFALAHGPGNLQATEVTLSHTDLWSAFDDFDGGLINTGVQRTDEQVAVRCASDANKSHHFGGYETLNNQGNVNAPSHTEAQSSNVPSNLSTRMNDFPNLEVAGAHSLATDHKSTNPFDMPFESDMESSNMSQFWDMSSMQTSLPNTQMPASDVDGVNELWFSQNSVLSYAPGGVSSDPTNGTSGFMAGKTPPSQMPNMHHAQGPAAAAASSVGGNPFA